MELYTTIIIYRILRDFNADDITDIPSFTLFLFENDKVRGEFYKKKKSSSSSDFTQSVGSFSTTL